MYDNPLKDIILNQYVSLFFVYVLHKEIVDFELTMN